MLLKTLIAVALSNIVAGSVINFANMKRSILAERKNTYPCPFHEKLFLQHDFHYSLLSLTLPCSHATKKKYAKYAKTRTLLTFRKYSFFIDSTIKATYVIYKATLPHLPSQETVSLPASSPTAIDGPP